MRCRSRASSASVDDEHDGRVLDGPDPRHVGPREGDAEQCEHEREQRRDPPLAHRGRARRHTPRDLEVREPHRVVGAPPPGEDEPREKRRQQRQREERQRAVEAQSILRSGLDRSAPLPALPPAPSLYAGARDPRERRRSGRWTRRSRPRAALAIAGDRIVGGVGTHEMALPSPERVDLRGRCVLPGLHRRPRPLPHVVARAPRRAAGRGRARSRRRSPRRRLATRRPASWLRGTRLARRALEPSTADAAALDEVTGDTPAALWRRTTTRSGSTPPRSRGRGAISRCRAASSSATTDGEPTGILREESAWRFRERFVDGRPEDEWVDAMRDGHAVANARGVAAVHDKDGWLGAPRSSRGIHEPTGSRSASGSRCRTSASTRLEALGLRSRFGDDYLRLGYIKAFMDGTLGSRTARLLDGSGVEITSARGARRDRPARRARRLAGRRPRDRRPGEPRRTRRVRGDARTSGSRSACASGSSTRSASHPEDIARFAELGVAASVQFTPRAIRPRPRRAVLGRPARAAPTRCARSLDAGAVVANGSDAPVEELDPLDGIAPACCGRSTTVRPGVPSRRSPWSRRCMRPQSRPRGSRATSGAGDARARLPRRPRRARPRSRRVRARRAAEVRVVATMVGGRWVYNPPSARGDRVGLQ